MVYITIAVHIVFILFALLAAYVTIAIFNNIAQAFTFWEKVV